MGTYIVGSIKATGVIVVGTQGFRAQYAEIEALAGLDAQPWAEAYGVPAFPTMWDLEKEFPPDPELYQPAPKPKLGVDLPTSLGHISLGRIVW